MISTGKAEVIFDLYDDEVVSKLVRVVAVREWKRYISRVKFSKLDIGDFYQEGWLVACKLRNSNAPNSISYFCTSLRHAMYRQVLATSMFSQMSEKDKWYYVSGHEDRMENQVNDEGLTLSEVVADGKDDIKDIENRMLVEQVMKGLNNEDKEEARRVMANVTPISRKRRELLPKKSLKILEGKTPYIKSVAEQQSEVKRVSFDKSKNRWVYYERINGKKKVLIRSRIKEEVEQFALARQTG